MSVYFQSTGKNPFPTHLIAEDGYLNTPNQRTDQDSYINGRGALKRSILPELRSTVKITTIPILRESEKLLIQESFPNRDVVEAEYWNDETHKLEKTTFYMPDITFKIMKEINGQKIYSGLELTFIAYEGDV